MHGSQYKEIVIGEIAEGLSGSKYVVCMKRDARNLGGNVPTAPVVNR